MSEHRLFAYIYCLSFLILIVLCETEVIDFNNQILSSQDVESRIQNLRNFMLGHNGLKKMRTDDAFLLRFLYATDFNVTASKRKVKKYYRYIIDEIDWIAVDINDKIKSLMKLNMRAMLPAIDRYGKKLFYMRLETVDPSKMSMGEVNQLEGIWYESVLDDPEVQKHGITLLVDVHKLSSDVLQWLTPKNVVKYMRKLDNIVVKNTTIYFVRSSPIIYLGLHIGWPYIPKQIRDKFRYFYDDIDAIFEHISPDNLPKQCGGNFVVDFEALNAELLSRTAEINKKLEHYKLITST